MGLSGFSQFKGLTNSSRYTQDNSASRMSTPSLDDGHRLLACLAIAIRRRDTVLVRQVAERADRILSDATSRRAFGRLRNYGVTEEDLAWLAKVEL